MKALLMLGCPELPIQTAIALYIANKLKKENFEIIVAGNNAALSLILNSDPEKHYVKNVMNIDKCIAELSEKNIDFELCFVFIHSDSGIVYLETVKAISCAKTVAIIFGKDIDKLVEASAGSFVIAAKSVHNPTPLKIKIDKVNSWAALMI